MSQARHVGDRLIKQREEAAKAELARRSSDSILEMFNRSMAVHSTPAPVEHQNTPWKPRHLTLAQRKRLREETNPEFISRWSKLSQAYADDSSDLVNF